MRSANPNRHRPAALLLTLLLVLFIAACSGGGSGSSFLSGAGGTMPIGPGTDPDPGTDPGDDDPLPGDSREEQVLVLVNQVRAQYGLDPVQWDDGAAAAALAHSLDMEARNFFDHVNPDGDTPGDRLEEAGVAFIGWGENIAQGYLTPESVMEAWMNSDGHRANILNPKWTHLGVGITDPVTPGPTWTQDFFQAP